MEVDCARSGLRAEWQQLATVENVVGRGENVMDGNMMPPVSRLRVQPLDHLVGCLASLHAETNKALSLVTAFYCISCQNI